MSTDPQPAAQDKARRLDVTLLPDVTSDEEGGFESRDEWLRGEVPPHHGS